MKNLTSKFMKLYDAILNAVFVLLLLFTAFVICYYTLPEKTSLAIAKAFSYSKNPETAKVFMDWLNGVAIGGGFTLWFSQKAIISRHLTGISNKFGIKSTQELLNENLDFQKIVIDFYKAEAVRFAQSPTMPKKARLYYQNFLTALEEKETKLKNIQTEIKQELPIVKIKKTKIKKINEPQETDLLL